MTGNQLIRRLANRIKDAGGVQPLAESWGVTPNEIRGVMFGRQKPSPKILEAMGLKATKVTFYRNAAGPG